MYRRRLYRNPTGSRFPEENLIKSHDGWHLQLNRTYTFRIAYHVLHNSNSNIDD